MAPIVQDIRSYIERATSLPNDQQKTEVRLYASLITIGFALSLMEPIFYLETVPQSTIYRVASLAPSAACVMAAFGFCLALLTPHLVALLFRPKSLSCKWPRRLAGYSAFGAAVTWLYLANLAIPMDVGGLEIAYAIRTAGCAVVGVTYGFSVNAQLGRDLRKRFDAEHH